MTDLDVAACSRWVVLALARLEQCAEVLDALNVFPVPDGDTGTNLLLTFRRAAEQARTASPSIADLSAALARGALLGARGNSGIITAQVLAGCAEAFADCVESVDGATLARALHSADEQAWNAVQLPVDGTVLSVSRAVANAVRDACSDSGELPAPDALAVATIAATAARHALARTPEQLPQLAEAGVVDSGGAGFVVLIDALRAALAREQPDPLPGVDDIDLARQPHGAGGQSGTGYEVMFVHDGADPEVGERLRHALAEIGDSVVVVGSPGQWHVHVHTDQPTAATAVGVEDGSVTDLRVVDLATGCAVANPETGRLGCVAGAGGRGVADLLRAVGVRPIASAHARRLSLEELLAAIATTGCDDVVLLPNDSDSLAMARAVVDVAPVRVHLIETRSIVQGLAAAAVFDPDGDPDQVATAMRAAAQGCRYGSVARAWKPALTPVGTCRTGDALGLIDDEIVAIGTDLADMTVDVTTRLLPGDLVTVVLGAQAPASLRDTIGQALGGTEVQFVDGGPDAYIAVIGVE